MIHSQNWVYTGVKRNHSVKIIHDTSSGNVVVFLNNQPLTEQQFNKAKNEITLFIDDELCKIHISTSGNNKYNYHFNVVRNSTSKPSKKRKARQKKQSRKVIYALSLLAFMAIGFPIFWISLNHYLDEKELDEYGVRSTGKITFPNSISALSTHNLAFVYQVNGLNYYGDIDISVSDKGYFMCENGMMLIPGDEFEVIYSSQNPEVSKILFDNPTSSQIQRYKDKCINKFYEFIKEDMPEGQKIFLAECLVESAYQNFGLNGLAQIEFLDENLIVNFQHNSGTFANFLLDPKFVQSLKECGEAMHKIKINIYF